MRIKVRNIFLASIGVLLLVNNSASQNFDSFYFKEAQPKKEESLTRFPSTIRGLYKSATDSTKRLLITADSISFEIPMVQFALLNELPAKNYKIIDSVLVKPDGTQLAFIQKNDTVFFVDFAQSVIFSTSEKRVIKKVDDKYVLSSNTGENKWDCFLLYKENSTICIAFFDFDKKVKEINENKKIEKIKNGAENYYLGNMKLKEFQKIIDKEYFPRKQYFHKRFDWQ